MDQVLRNTAANRDLTFYADETATAADGAVTVTVTKADGTIVLTDAATTAVSGSTGTYRYVLPAQATLDQLTEVWTGTFSGLVQTVTTSVEIVGGFYLSLAEIRALKNLESDTRFTTAALREARQWFEETFEDATGVAWVPRYRRVTLDGNNRPTLLLPDLHVRSIISARVYADDGLTFTVLTAAELADLTVSPIGELGRRSLGYWTAGVGNIVVEYERGHLSPTTDIRNAAKVAIRDYLLTDNVGNRQFSVATEAGIVRSSTPGEGHTFGLPFVDEVVARRSEKHPAVA